MAWNRKKHRIADLEGRDQANAAALKKKDRRISELEALLRARDQRIRDLEEALLQTHKSRQDAFSQLAEADSRPEQTTS